VKEPPDVVPVSDVRRGIARLIERVNRSERPVFVSQRGYLTAVFLSCDRYERLRRDAEAGAGEHGRRIPDGRFLRTQYGPDDYETGRLFAQEGLESGLDDLTEDWPLGE
jgi:prevent-host-death family protein